MTKPLLLIVAAICLAGCQQNQPQPGKSTVWDLRSNQEMNSSTPGESPQTPREGSTHTRPINQTVTVRFRRDALGYGNSNLPLLSNGTPNWPVSITGTLIEIDEDWITIESNGHRYSIPASAILMVERE